MERRRHERQELSAAVRFAWESKHEGTRRGTGISRDFSPVGLFVWTDDPPPVGAKIHFTVDLNTGATGIEVTVRGSGQVRRAEKSDTAGQLGGFGVSTRRMSLERPKRPSQ
jgi:hypothetical protein